MSFDFKRDFESFVLSLAVKLLCTQDISESSILKYLYFRRELVKIINSGDVKEHIMGRIT